MFLGHIRVQDRQKCQCIVLSSYSLAEREMLLYFLASCIFATYFCRKERLDYKSSFQCVYSVKQKSGSEAYYKRQGCSLAPLILLKAGGK